MPEQKVAPAKTGIFSGLTDSISKSFSGIFGSKDTRESLAAEKAKLEAEDRQIRAKIEAIDDNNENLPAGENTTDADASADSKDPVILSADNMGGGRRRTKRSTRRSTRRSKRSKKTKRRRSKRSGKRTRR
jgi:hypothetical protein